MKIRTLVMLSGFSSTLAFANDMSIVGVIDGPLSGGHPKAVELRVNNNISDLSQCGLGVASNGNGNSEQRFTFPIGSADAGDFVTVTANEEGFQNFFGFAPDHVSDLVNINGDDAILLHCNGVVIDTFGDINTDGTDEDWEYLDGWASRIANTGPDGENFVISNWAFSGPNALDDESSNSTANLPYPIRSTGGNGGGGGGGESACFNCPSLDKIADASSFDAASYYAEVTADINNNESAKIIKSTLSTVLANNHKVLTYSEVWTALTHTDEDPDNADNVILWYKGTSQSKHSNGSGSQSSNQDNWNREHSWPKSHGFSSQSNEAYTDIHHLRPTDISVNSSRGNLDFDDSDNELAEAPSNRVDGDSFEPRDDIKGDVARMMFYMDTRYQGNDITPDLSLVNRLTSTGEANLGKLCRLYEWHMEDPVDSSEEARNNAIYEYQGNRNPFIDNPNWVGLLFDDAACDGSGGGGGSGDSPALIISEYIEGGGDNKAIELYNLSNSTVDLSESNVSLARFSNGATTPVAIELSGVIAANSTFVIVGTSASDELKAYADQQSGGISHNGDDSYVLLADDVVLDSFGQVGIDPGSNWGAGETSTKDRSLVRKSSVMSGDVTIDDEFDPSLQWVGFAKDTFTNLGSHDVDDGSTGGGFGQCSDDATLISTIQGSSASSPMVGDTVTIEAIVTQVTPALNGFFMQQAAADLDNDETTSEGIFVSGDSQFAVGQVLRIQGRVSESYGKTQITATDAPLDCGTGSIDALTITMPFTSQDSPEAWEGMLVTFNDPLTVSNNADLARYGEITLSSKRLFNPTNVFTPNSEQALALAAENRRNTLILDDGMNGINPEQVIYPTGGLSAQNTLRAGSTVSSLSGIMDYSFGKYRVLPSQEPTFVGHTNRLLSADVMYEGLTVASFNVLNLFNGDGQNDGFPTSRGADSLEEYQRQLDKVVNAIIALDADIVGLMEIENDGVGSNSTLSQLVSALNDYAGQGTYQFVNTGGEIGDDEIAVALIYRTESVSLEGPAKINENPIFDRPPLAQEFVFNKTGDSLAVVVNHFKSKGSCSRATGLDQDQGDGQGCFNDKRMQQAQALSNWMASSDGFASQDNRLVIGDLNAYAKEDPISALKATGYQDLLASDDMPYSYVFDGQAGYLDHAMASVSLAKHVDHAFFLPINADEPRALDYNLESKSPEQQALFYAPDEYRSSDHDPVIVRFDFVPAEVTNVLVSRVKHLKKDHIKLLKYKLVFWKKDVTIYSERELRLRAEIATLNPTTDTDLIAIKRQEANLMSAKQWYFGNLVNTLEITLGHKKANSVNVEQSIYAALIDDNVENHLKSFKSTKRNKGQLSNRQAKKANKAKRKGNKKRARELNKSSKSNKALAQVYEYLLNVARAHKGS